MVGEFLRLHPDQALSVHILSVTCPDEFRKLFKYNRTLSLIFNIRNAMRFLNIDYEHRWARYFKKVVERALNAKKIFLSASALQGL